MKAEKKLHVLILSAGSGTRMGNGTPKQMIDLFGKSVLRRSVEAFCSLPFVSDITVVTRKEDMAFAEETCRGLSVSTIIAGGKTRAESAKIGFETIKKDGYVAVHDAARCLVTPEEIELVAKKAFETGAASAGVSIFDTLKRVDEENVVKETLQRNGLFAAATPQIFSCDLYQKALDACKDLSAVTDDNMLLEAIGIPVSMVSTSKNNVKITYPEDVTLAKAILSLRGESAVKKERIGHGYDVHAFADGRDLILGGVKIPYEKGLHGHSDADVLLHAVMDALLGAAGLGDIGRHFPDSDEKYHGIASLILLSEVAEKLQKAGAEIENIDVTLVLQTPKIAKYLPLMEENIANSLNIPKGKINIKATTEEHLGFTGRGEGAACHAVALISK